MSATRRSGVLGEPTWVASGDRSLLTVVHTPESGSASGVVVICDSMARDHVLTQRSLRLLAISLARHGLVAVRFHWTGEADSAMSFEDEQARVWDPALAPSLVELWEQDLAAVVEFARSSTGLEEVSLVGIRLGALLAKRGSESLPVTSLVLWEPVGSGRRWVRGQETLLRMSPHTPEAAEQPALPEGGADLASRRLGPVDRTAISGLRLGTLAESRTADNTLVLADTGEPVERAIGQLLQTTQATVVRLEGLDELVDYTRMFMRSDDRPIGEVVRWLAERAGPPRPVADWSPRTRAVVATGPNGEIVEELTDVAGFPGIVTYPATEPVGTIITVPAAGEPREGPAGLWTQVCRAAALRGLVAVRADTVGVGEALTGHEPATPWPYRRGMVEDYVRVWDWTRRHTGHAATLVGSCSGSWTSLHVAARRPVPTALTLNLIAYLLYPPTDPLPWYAEFSPYSRPIDPPELQGRISFTTRMRVMKGLTALPPYPVSSLLSRLDLAQQPEQLLEWATRHGTRVEQILGNRDHRGWELVRGPQGQARLVARGRDIRTTHDGMVDHAMLLPGARLAAYAWVLDRLDGGPSAGPAASRTAERQASRDRAAHAR
ncbi:hypothetical protein ACQP1U_14515 [Actinomycetota bacterium]